MKNLQLTFLLAIGITTMSFLEQPGQLTFAVKDNSLNGTVKSVCELKYFVKEVFGEVTKSSLGDSTVWQFDTAGNLTSQSKCAGNSCGTLRNIFDTNLRLTEILNRDSDGMLVEHTAYSYDDKGNCIELNAWYPNGNLKQKQISRFDDKNLEIEMNSYDGKGVLEFRIVKTYDGNGVLTESSRYSYDKKLESRQTYKYSKEGWIVELRVVDDKNKQTELKKWKYDKEGKLTGFSHNKDGIFILKLLKSYTTDGRLSVLTVSEDADYVYAGRKQQAYTYDEKGQCIGNHITNRSGTKDVYRWELTYDSQENVIKSLEIHNDIPYSLVERKIVYY